MEYSLKKWQQILQTSYNNIILNIYIFSYSPHSPAYMYMYIMMDV